MKARKCYLAKINDLIPPPDFRPDESTVKMLADSIREYGLREPIVVVGRHILHGSHRWEAARSIGLHDIEVVVDDYAETVEANAARVIVENLHRRHMTGAELDAMRAELVQLKTASIAAKSKGSDLFPQRGKNSRGRPEEPKTKAIREVAQETGATPKAVARSVEKHTERIEQELDESLESGRLSNHDEYRNAIPSHLIGKWDDIRAAHEALESLCRKAKTITGQLKQFGVEQSSYAQRWGETVSRVGAEARLYKPYAVCPKCGGNGCSLCREVGFVFGVVLDRKKYEAMVGES